MKIIHFLSILAIGTVLSFTSCSKGATGDTGPAGPAGANGNANVTPAQYTVTNWNYDGTSQQWYVTFNPPALTSDIANGGAVEVFLSVDGGNSWNAIPTAYIGGVVTAYWTYTYTTGALTVDFTWSNLQPNSDPTTVYATNVEFNVICIAPSVVAQHPNTNWKNASDAELIPEVQAALHNNNK